MTEKQIEHAEQLHRMALYGILFDLKKWMVDKAKDCRHRAGKRRKAGNIAESKMLCEQAEGITMCLERLQILREQHLEHSTAKRVQKLHANAQTKQVFYEPTPEEIAAKCAEFQASWSEIEMQRRYWQQPRAVEMDGQKDFIF